MNLWKGKKRIGPSHTPRLGGSLLVLRSICQSHGNIQAGWLLMMLGLGRTSAVLHLERSNFGQLCVSKWHTRGSPKQPLWLQFLTVGISATRGCRVVVTILLYMPQHTAIRSLSPSCIVVDPERLVRKKNMSFVGGIPNHRNSSTAYTQCSSLMFLLVTTRLLV